jgi:hypothetical protein
MTRPDLTALLTLIVSEQTDRGGRVSEFQEIVFHAAKPIEGFNEREWEIMADLAYDLDFYLSDLVRRREDASYYGEKRLIREISESLAKLLAGE